MQESDVMTATRHALMSRGYWPFHPTDGILCPKCHMRIVPPSKGRPDLSVLHPAGMSSVCEVKDVNHAKHANALYFSEITPEQRDWLDAWDTAAGMDGPGAFLSVGLIMPFGSKTTLTDVWIIPWGIWKRIECEWGSYGQTGVGITPDLYKRKPDVPRNLYLDAYRQLNVYHIERHIEADGRPGWQMHDNHPLAYGHEVQQRFKQKEQV